MCTHFMDDTAVGVDNSAEMIPALRNFFDCFRQSGLKLSSHKSKIRTKSTEKLGLITTPRSKSLDVKIKRRFRNTSECLAF